MLFGSLICCIQTSLERSPFLGQQIGTVECRIECLPRIFDLQAKVFDSELEAEDDIVLQRDIVMCVLEALHSMHDNFCLGLAKLSKLLKYIKAIHFEAFHQRNKRSMRCLHDMRCPSHTSRTIRQVFNLKITTRITMALKKRIFRLSFVSLVHHVEPVHRDTRKRPSRAPQTRKRSPTVSLVGLRAVTVQTDPARRTAGSVRGGAGTAAQP
jgi:hypothetical protein